MLAGCNRPVQQNIQDRDNALGRNKEGGQPTSNYQEALQIQEIESWKDQANKIVMWYVEFPPGSGNVIPLQCKGVPTSSTESLEPNIGNAYYSSTGEGRPWRVPIDGADTSTSEMAGRDGTYGDPVPYRQCFTVDGQYYDIPSMGVPYMTSSAVMSFPPSTVKRDIEAEMRLLQASKILEAGGCVDTETGLEIECPQ